MHAGGIVTTLIAARDGRRQLGPVEETRVRHSGRLEDMALHIGGVFFPADPFDNQSKENIAGAGVAVARARFKVEWLTSVG